MLQDTNEEPQILYVAQPVAACYYNARLSIILVGAVGRIEGESEKRLRIKERYSFKNALPDEVADKLQQFCCNIWSNDDICFENVLTKYCKTLSFKLENQNQIDSLGDLVSVLSLKGKIFAPSSIEFDDSMSENNAFKILLVALKDFLFDKPSIKSSYLIGSKKLANPYAPSSRYYPVENPNAAQKYQDAWKR